MGFPMWKWLADPQNLTAISSAVIAAFTIILAVVASVQAEFTRRAIGLARAEFLATQRPRLVLREVHWDWAADGKSYVAYTLVNAGGSGCRIEESVLRYRSDVEDPGVLDAAGVNEIGAISLASGEYRFLKSPMVSEGEEVAAAAAEMGFLSDHSFRGVIIYSDARGIRRRMVFRRVCRRNNTRPSQRFVVPENNDEFEYTD